MTVPLRRITAVLHDAPWSSLAARAAGMRELYLVQATVAWGLDEVQAFAQRLAIEVTHQLVPTILQAAGLDEWLAADALTEAHRDHEALTRVVRRVHDMVLAKVTEVADAERTAAEREVRALSGIVSKRVDGGLFSAEETEYRRALAGRSRAAGLTQRSILALRGTESLLESLDFFGCRWHGISALDAVVWAARAVSGSWDRDYAHSPTTPCDERGDAALAAGAALCADVCRVVDARIKKRRSA